MTKEELEKEAGEYANNLAFVFETDIVQRIVRERVRLALIDVLEPREKRIEELEAQIEKMKCCENCKHKNLNWSFSPICEARDKIKIENPLTCKCDKWEIKENDSVRKN